MKRKNPAAVALGKRRKAGMTKAAKRMEASKAGSASWANLTPAEHIARVQALQDARRLHSKAPGKAKKPRSKPDKASGGNGGTKCLGYG